MAGMTNHLQTAEVDFLSVHNKLKKYIQELKSNVALINSHCYAIDECAKNCENNIETEFADITNAIEIRKKNLLCELGTTQKSKRINARNLFLSISKELEQCESIDLEMDRCNTFETEDMRRLYTKINTFFVHRMYYHINDDTIQNSAQIKARFYKAVKNKLLQTLKKFGSFEKTHSLLNDYRSLDSFPNNENINYFQTNANSDHFKLQKRSETDTVTTAKRRKPNARKNEIVVSDKARQWRQKQIEIGTQSECYKKLIELYPKYTKCSFRKRNPSFVQPPKINEKIGKQRWKGKYYKWRTFLHQITAKASDTKKTSLTVKLL